MKHEDTDMLTIQEAAREVGVKENTLYQAIRRGALQAELRFGRKVVSRRSLMSWHKNPEAHQRGNPQFLVK